MCFAYAVMRRDNVHCVVLPMKLVFSPFYLSWPGPEAQAIKCLTKLRLRLSDALRAMWR